MFISCGLYWARSRRVNFLLDLVYLYIFYIYFLYIYTGFINKRKKGKEEKRVGLFGFFYCLLIRLHSVNWYIIFLKVIVAGAIDQHRWVAVWWQPAKIFVDNDVVIWHGPVPEAGREVEEADFLDLVTRWEVKRVYYCKEAFSCALTVPAICLVHNVGSAFVIQEDPFRMCLAEIVWHSPSSVHMFKCVWEIPDRR